jgi:hypothetical protein
MKFPKPTRERNPAYLQWLRGRRCAVWDCWVRAEPHHTKTVGSGGSDETAIPLCRMHHSQCQHMGNKRFAARYGLDIEWTIAKCLIEFERTREVA